ncbi:MAG: hypothetical protein N3B21_02520 [Clostridia bacterium]|nr:hypothetical protein [Clostridia bacterium]
MLPKNIKELDKIRNECRSMVAKRALLSGGATLIPIPGTDIIADIVILTRLLSSINEKFGLSRNQIEQLDYKAKSVILKVVKKCGSDLVGKIITRQLALRVIKKMGIKVAAKEVSRFVPIIGQVASVSMGYSAMKALGEAHINDCYNVIKEYLINKGEL